MKLTIYGAGYVGLVTGVCLADVGHEVLCMDTEEDRVLALRRGESPIYEPGLNELLAKNIRHQRLSFSSDKEQAANYATLQIIAVGTPQDEHGAADLQYVTSVAQSIGQYANNDVIVVNKSTVPVGTAEKVRALVEREFANKAQASQVSMVSNPEFLREGSAIEDFLKPDRIIIGTDCDATKKVMDELYRPFSRNHYRIIFMDIPSAELTKYAANAMLATKISFINEIALIADQVGADIENVRVGIGSDPRIGYSFIYAGCGYGGSCFPKDVKALINIGKESEPMLLNAVNRRNVLQQQWLVQKVLEYFDNKIAGLKVAVWGLAFKPKTDDMREATSLVTINTLLQHGAEIYAYDPVACEKAREVLQDTIEYDDDSPYGVLEQADMLIIHTEWKEFVVPNLSLMAEKMKRKVIFDGRNMYDPKEMKKQGWDYVSVGRNFVNV